MTLWVIDSGIIIIDLTNSDYLVYIDMN